MGVDARWEAPMQAQGRLEPRTDAAGGRSGSGSGSGGAARPGGAGTGDSGSARAPSSGSLRRRHRSRPRAATQASAAAAARRRPAPAGRTRPPCPATPRRGPPPSNPASAPRSPSDASPNLSTTSAATLRDFEVLQVVRQSSDLAEGVGHARRGRFSTSPLRHVQCFLMHHSCARELVEPICNTSNAGGGSAGGTAPSSLDKGVTIKPHGLRSMIMERL